MRRVQRWLGWWVLGLLALAGCRLNPECFRDDECAAGSTCSAERRCVAPDAATDAGPDARTPDVGPLDAGEEDVGPVDASDGGSPDGAVDGGPPDAADGGFDAGACTERADGGPLDDEQAPFLDVLLLHFDEAAGALPEAMNTSGELGVATCSAGASCPTTGACGVWGRAYHFQGAPLETTRPVIFREAESTYTLELWVRPTQTSTGCLFQAVEGASAVTELNLCLDEARRPFVDLPSRLVGSPIPLDTWTHLTVRRFATPPRLELLQDGLQTAAQDLTAAVAFTSSRLLVGGDANPARGWHFVGDIDELRLSYKVLIPDTDLSIHRPEAVLAWEVGGQVWAANENGFGAHMITADGRMPRVAPDLRRILFTRCNSSCDTWAYDRRTMSERRLTTTGNQDFNVPVAFSPSGAHLYHVDRDICASHIWRVPIAGGQGDFIRTVSDRHIVGFDVGTSPGGGADMLVFTTESCTGPYASSVERLVDPSSGASPVEAVLTSTTPELAYGWIRTDPYASNGEIVFDERITGGDGQVFHRVVRTTAEPAAPAPTQIWFGARSGTYGMRAEWYVMSAPNPDPGQGTEILKYDYPTGGGAFRWLTTRTPTITESIHPDLRALWP